MKDRCRRIAIIAYDGSAYVVPEQTKIFIADVLKLVDRLIIVSTQLQHAALNIEDARLEIVIQPSVDYDFCLFQAGLQAAKQLWCYDELILAKSSANLSSRDSLAQVFERMRNRPCDIWGLNASWHIAYHLQTHFLVFRKSLFTTRSFGEFWDKPRVVDSRLSFNLNYAVSLTQYFIERGTKIATVCRPSSLNYLQALMLGRWRAGRSSASLPSSKGSHEIDKGVPEFQLTACRAEELNAEIAVVLHLYYVDLLEEITRYIENIILPVDIFISVSSAKDYYTVKNFFDRRKQRVHIYMHENRGRDVAPFISLLNSGLLARYTCVCKIHSKKSLHMVKTAGCAWRNRLFDSLLGNSLRVLQIIDLFRRFPQCGMVGPEHTFITPDEPWAWGSNEVTVRALAQQLGVRDGQVQLGFFAGTMFWFRPVALEGLRALNLQLTDFAPEQNQTDGTLAHALERLFPLAMERSAHFIASTARVGEPLKYSRYADASQIRKPLLIRRIGKRLHRYFTNFAVFK